MIFVDAGAFLARFLSRDQHHALAIRSWEKLERTRDDCVTSNVVLVGAFTLLARRAGYSFAAERARRLLAAREMTFLRPEADDDQAALEWFEKFADQKVGFADCISFALMRRHRITRVFTFDAHFQRAGFDVWPANGA